MPVQRLLSEGLPERRTSATGVNEHIKRQPKTNERRLHVTAWQHTRDDRGAIGCTITR